jgi:hypothetical protein
MSTVEKFQDITVPSSNFISERNEVKNTIKELEKN